jgi:CRP/FNR family transcriptional regulator
MPRADIADFLGLTVETVSRSFSELKKRGLIRLPDAHTVELADRTALAELAGIELH